MMGFNSGITLYGYYSEDPALLDEIVLPEGLDKEALKTEILHSCGSLYPFIQHPEMLKESVHNWFKINERNFERILLAVMAEYSPIENYDRTEEHTIIRSGNETENGTNQNNRNENNQTSGTEDSSGTENTSGTSYSSSVTSTDGSETDQRAADNSESFRNTTKKISEAESSGTDNSSTSASGSSSNSGSFSNTGYMNGTENGRFQTDRNKSENETESIRAHGNIGTTRNSEMVLDEIELRKYNIYEDIASRFADKFLLCIY